MKLRTAKTITRISAVLAVILAIVYRLTYNYIAMYGFLAALAILILVMVLFVKCPHCGAHFHRLSDSALRAGRCPYCGEEIDY
ncbi:MAG: hypothetical protein IJM61_05155 [Firmicutes bacterium]|nr:hypothetical protein [Bacillota bacterium]